MRPQKKNYLPFGIKILPRQLMGTPRNFALEHEICKLLNERFYRIKDSVETDDGMISMLKILPSLTGSLASRGVLAQNSLSLILEDPIFAALVIVSDFEKLGKGMAHRVERSPVACEILCNYVRRKFPAERDLLDQFAAGLQSDPIRMVRLLMEEHSNPTQHIESIAKSVSNEPLATSGTALFAIAYDESISQGSNQSELKDLIAKVAEDPAALFEAAFILHKKGISAELWASHLEKVEDSRWIYQFLTKSLCHYDALTARLEKKLMKSTPWAVEYLDQQPMDAPRLDELFRECYDQSKGSSLRLPLTWWYQCHFPEIRRSRKTAG